jgi:hypothetical protein
VSANAKLTVDHRKRRAIVFRRLARPALTPGGLYCSKFPIITLPLSRPRVINGHV